MASATHIMKKMDLHHGLSGPVGLLAEGGVGFAVSYGLGQLYHRKNDKWYGKQAPRIAAAVGKVGAVVASMLTGGEPGLIVGGLNAVGQAGLNAIGLEMGLRHARKSSGKKAILVPKDTDIKKIAGASEATSMGALGRAQKGRGASWAQIEELASGR